MGFVYRRSFRDIRLCFAVIYLYAGVGKLDRFTPVGVDNRRVDNVFARCAVLNPNLECERDRFAYGYTVCVERYYFFIKIDVIGKIYCRPAVLLDAVNVSDKMNKSGD